ncbi:MULTISPECIES: alpha-lytic protease prodomain-containing protein [unclassified Streptomyces]|uniref:alpha-lytic protease prodomain-containing protein n=1 Tax=unclassified Streptomyces TaxID=2593676 RepID=UPI0005A804E3|nr:MULTISPECIES: alpha-lytic protease prodomain-containing protein [unclassified Streptomyces]ODA72278.1 Alpha-lytic protease precursor [Streptomyces sp. AVP053U2]
MVLRHARTARRTALAALGGLVLTVLPSAAVAGSAPPSEPASGAARALGTDRASAPVLDALQRDLGLSPAQASERLANEAEAGTRAGILRNALGDRFAGAWVRGAVSGELSVATTDAEDVAAIEAQGAEAVVVTRPLADLRAAKDRLDAAAATRDTAGTPLWYVDVPANRLVVQARTVSAGAAFVDAAGIDDQDVTIHVSAVRPRLLQDITGGDAYYVNGTARCSVGFSVTRDAQQGFATTGHCGDRGDTTTGFDRSAQGTFQDSVFPGRDMAWVGTNDAWTATPGVRARDGQEVQVTGSVEALVGAAVCRSGSTTGWHCGTVQQHETSVSYAEGTVDGVTRTTVCAEPGDSGGPFVAGSQAQGVTSGGSGDCRRGGTTFYQPVNPILADFGLTLTTDPGQTATPDPQDGAEGPWTAGRVYPAGATVTRDGVRYRCLQTHQAQSAWAPAGTPALWQRL